MNAPTPSPEDTTEQARFLTDYPFQRWSPAASDVCAVPIPFQNREESGRKLLDLSDALWGGPVFFFGQNTTPGMETYLIALKGYAAGKNCVSPLIGYGNTPDEAAEKLLCLIEHHCANGNQTLVIEKGHGSGEEKFDVRRDGDFLYFQNKRPGMPQKFIHRAAIHP